MSRDIFVYNSKTNKTTRFIRFSPKEDESVIKEGIMAITDDDGRTITINMDDIKTFDIYVQWIEIIIELDGFVDKDEYYHKYYPWFYVKVGGIK